MSITEQESPPRKRPLWRRLIGPLFSLVLVGAVYFWFLPQFTSLSDVWAAVQAMSAVQVSVLVIATVWNLATYQFVMVTATPGMTLRQATVSTETTTAVAKTLIGGAAIALWLPDTMNSAGGFSRSRTSVSLLTSGLWNNFVKLGLPVFALALLAFSEPPSGGRWLAGLLGVAGLVAAGVLLWLVLRSRESAARVGRGLGRVVSWLLR